MRNVLEVKSVAADSNDPLIIGQPEDALHATWIEEYLVAKFRDLRGGRTSPPPAFREKAPE
ncbi:hypothetical protein ABZS66_36040 [Dactylosporangium sp. NPDC005572]|uniref:hypothetical protein n=1 Tax=Dactylosporangium sp. NPDC005572 TaxID=3156889 RepID=UPI0033A2F26E